MKKGIMNYIYPALVFFAGFLLVISLINYASLPNLIPIQWNGSDIVTNSIGKNSFIVSLAVIFIGFSFIFYLYKNNKIKNNSRANNVIFSITSIIIILAIGYCLLRLI